MLITASREILSPKSQVSGRRRIYFINTDKVVYADEHLYAYAGLAPDNLTVVWAFAFFIYHAYFIMKLKY
jgi:hypothetical protein